jgi:hypothetical protein
MIPEKDLIEIMAMKAVADQCDREMDAFQFPFVEYCNKRISEIYADKLQNMESEGFKQLNEKVLRIAASLTVDINNIIFRNQIKK